MKPIRQMEQSKVHAADSDVAPGPKAPASSEAHAETAARCHEIQVCLGQTDVPDLENVLEIGMAVRLALHLRGLQLLAYDVVKLVAVH
jgi:hypothetical protein